MRKSVLAFLALSLAVMACSLPVLLESTPEPAPIESTPTVFVPPTQTPTLQPTPISTLIPGVRIENADQAFFYGDWEQALQAYQTAFDVEQDPEVRFSALLGVGRTRYQMGAYLESLDTLGQLVANYPESPQLGLAYFALAQSYEALLRYAEAADAYERYLSLRPGVIDSYILEWQGDALVAVGDYMNAIDVYQGAISAPRLDGPLPIEIKIANAYAALGDYETALVAYQDVYTRTTNDYIKAQVDYLMGQTHTAMGQTDQAHAAYLDAVENYPLSYDSYQSLIILVDSGFPVSEFDRGLVDYFAGQYSLSIAAFDRYLNTSTENAGTAFYYKGLAYRALDDPVSAIESWDVVIESYPSDEHWVEAWDEKAFTQWAYLDQYEEARQTLLDFVDGSAWHPSAAEFLFRAARIAERDLDLGLAASIWERIPPEYPSSSLVPRAIFLSGISYYRAENYNSALASFEWYLGSSAAHEDKSAAYFWIAKTYQALGDESSAQVFFKNAANEDPTGYYSERARDFITGRAPFEAPTMYDLTFDVEAEKAVAEAWMRSTFAIPENLDLASPEPLQHDLRFARGTELWNLGLYDLARSEFESLRADIRHNPMDNYRLANYLVELGLYRTAIFAAREVLNLHGMDDAATMNAPAYFNHLRFGSYYRDLILPAAEAHDFHPLFLFSVLRQESLFEGFVRSSAGARGLMQIMPATGASVAANAGWPPGYSDKDLYRPVVSINLGADYLDAQRDYFGGDLYAALAAYNGGPGNAAVWRDLAGDDPDLFVEIIRFDETRNYIRGIYEVFSIYRRLYDRSP